MSSKPCIAGIDFGTTSLSAVILGVDDNKVVKVFNYISNAYIPSSDHLVKEQSIEALGSVFDRLMNDVVSVPGVDIKAYGFTGQMHGIVGVNAKNEAVTNLVTWEDKSGDMVLPDGTRLLDKVKSLSGVRTLSSGYGVVTLYKWLVVEKRDDIARFCTVADYFAGRLAGKIVMAPSMAHSAGFFDIATNKWEKDAIEKTGLDFSVFPQIAEEGEIIGYTGDCPVTAAIGDNQASFMGSVLGAKNTILLNIGTGAQVSMLLDKCEKEKYGKYIDGFETQLRPYDKNHFLMAAGFINGGASYKALFNFFKESGVALFDVDPVEENLLWANMEASGWQSFEAGLAPEVSHLLSGERKCPDARGSVTGITPDNFHPGSLVVGYLTGMSKYYKSSFPDELIEKADRIFGSGNGLKRNKLFVKIVEKTFGKPVHLTQYNEEAAVGAALNCVKSLEGRSEKESDMNLVLNNVSLANCNW